MSTLRKTAWLTGFLSLALSASAQTLSGTVTNGTTNKPAAGDEVILINISNGMDVAANTKADSAGKFSFKLTDAAGPHLIRAVHQGVTYHQMAPPGTNQVALQVYDVAPKVADLSVTADVLRLQAESGTLQGVRLFVVTNTSSPAKTQMNDHNFEFFLPPGAKVEQSQARAPNGQPIAADAVPQAEKNRYAIAFPLRPGETQFQVEFTLAYTGEAKIDPKPLYPAEHLVVVLPKSMHFTASDSSSFKSMQDPGQTDTLVQVAQQTHVGQQLGFAISGTGTISDQPAQVASGAASQDQNQSGRDNRPGGGLGAPIDAPDALQPYRWPIIGAFALVLALGGWLVTKRQTGPAVATGSAVAGARGPLAAPSVFSAPITGPGAAAITGSVASSAVGAASLAGSAGGQSAVAASKSTMLLEGLKEELFQLEVERKQGKITQAEYEQAKSALDHTLDRALKRQS